MIVGNIVPPDIVSALGVLLYGMFLAIIIPPAKINIIVRILVFFSMVASFICSKLPLISSLSDGTRIIILTVLISGAAAVLFPIRDTDKAKDKKSAMSVETDDKKLKDDASGRVNYQMKEGKNA